MSGVAPGGPDDTPPESGLAAGVQAVFGGPPADAPATRRSAPDPVDGARAASAIAARAAALLPGGVRERLSVDAWRAEVVRESLALTVGRAAAATPVNAGTLTGARLLIERTMRAAAPPLRGTDHAAPLDGSVRGEWVRGPRARRTDAVVLYVHGGGFVAGSARGYRGVASRISTATRLPVFTVDYRLAPEHPFPAAPDDVAAAFGYLLACGVRPERIVVAGDSAGGFLAAHLALRRADGGLPGPAALVLFSPIADLTLGTAADGPAARDGLLSEPVARRAISRFTDTPFDLRPTRGTWLPPLLVQAGDTEFFGADAAELVRRWQVAGGHARLHRWPGRLHAFQTLPVLFPEARAAYRAAARFVAAHLDPAAAA
ncbi:alpha/beta hydrolase [Nocardia thailandica]